MKNIRNNRNIKIVIFTLIAILTLGVGYAVFSGISLLINGAASATTGDLSYSVKFLSGNGNGPTVTSEYAGVSGTANVTSNTTATFSVTGFSEEGQTAVITYRIKNDSEGVGARLSLEVDNSSENFKVIESINDTELQAGDETEATVTVEVSHLPLEANATVSAEMTARLIAEPISNKEATGNDNATTGELTQPQYKYSVSGQQNNIGENIVGEQPSFEAAKTAYGHPVSTAHILSGGLITESYVAFEKNNTVYYLKGLVNEENEDTHPVYDANVAILQEAFGPDWQSKCEDVGAWLTCRDGGFYADAYKSGSVSAGDSNDNWFCHVNFSGVSWCYY